MIRPSVMQSPSFISVGALLVRHSSQPLLCGRPTSLPAPSSRFGRAITPRASASSSSQSSSSPAPTAQSDGEVFCAPPPASFYQAIQQSAAATAAAIADGETLLEIEFPPLPTAQLESSAVGAYTVIDANIQLAVDFARSFATAGKRVVIAFPDLIEKDRAVEQNDENEEPVEGIRFAAIRDQRKGNIFEMIWTKPEVEIAARDDDDMFVVIGASAQELPDVEKLVETAGDRPVVLFNLKLDVSRGDLGLPAFPRKALHWRFLSRVLPVYYLRTRTYSRTLLQPPYLVNYSGALYRVYPGPYQVLLDTAAGNYRRLSTLSERPALGAVRETLTDGLDLGEQFTGRMGKSTTWWEEDRTKQESNKWRL
jgi:Domain of unknown function (DUF1995)